MPETREGAIVPSRATVLLTTATMAIVSLGGAACAGSQGLGAASATAELRDAVAATLAAGTARLHAEGRLASGDAVVVTLVDGVVSLGTGDARGRSTVRWEGPSGSHDARPQPAGFLYVENDAYVERSPDDWVRYDRPASEGHAGIGLVAPDSLLEALNDASDVEYLGRAELEGSDVDRYRATIDLGLPAFEAARGCLTVTTPDRSMPLTCGNTSVYLSRSPGISRCARFSVTIL